jgi:hypothetical protein
MGRYDFDFGYNVAPPTKDAPTYACMGRCVCSLCGKLHGYCSEVEFAVTGVTHDPIYTSPGVPYGEWERQQHGNAQGQQQGCAKPDPGSEVLEKGNKDRGSGNSNLSDDQWRLFRDFAQDAGHGQRQQGKKGKHRRA